MSSTTKNASAGTAANTKSEMKIGLVRFLQLCSQKRGIEALLKSKYASAVKTKTEWQSTVETMLRSKTR